MSEPDALLKRASRSMFWNATLLPLMTVFNLVAAMLIRRHFGLESGRYDVVIGLVNTWMMVSGLGITTTLGQFTPGVENRHGRAGVATFFRRVGSWRLALLFGLLVPINVFADAIAGRLGWGDSGAWLIHLTALLTVVRAANDLVMKSLQALLDHLAANVVQFAQAIGAAAVMVVITVAGGSIEFVVAGLIVAGLTILFGGVARLRVAVAALPDRDTASDANFSPGVTRDKLARFSLFMYLFGWLNYFVTPAFASPMIAAIAGTDGPVALFNVGFQLPQLAVVVVLAGFQGLYRPLFARLVDEGDLGKLRNAFSEVSKVQAVFLLPAGAGIYLLAGDYVPMLFGDQFAAAVPIAQALALFLVIESLLNLGTILLSVDHRYRDVIIAMGIRVGAVPPFVYLAARGDLVGAAIVFGAARVASFVVGHFLAVRGYGVRFPVAFALRAALPTAAMVAVLWIAHGAIGPGPPRAIGLTLLGAAVIAIAYRLLPILGEHEIALIERASLPGGRHLVRWLR